MNSQLIIGCGTGRCGTTSLAALLDSQDGAHVTHERFRRFFAWGQPGDRLDKVIASGAGQRFYGDVALQWGSCLPLVLDRGARVIIMKRDFDSWLASWEGKLMGRNNWQPAKQGGTPSSKWFKCFPKYKGLKNRDQALRRYYEHYYEEIAPAAIDAYPEQVRVFYIDALNSEAGIRGILDHVGIPRERQIIRIIHKNAGRQRRAIAA